MSDRLRSQVPRNIRFDSDLGMVPPLRRAAASAHAAIRTPQTKPFANQGDFAVPADRELIKMQETVTSRAGPGRADLERSARQQAIDAGYFAQFEGRLRTLALATLDEACRSTYQNRANSAPRGTLVT